MAVVGFQIEQPASGDMFPEGTRVVTWGPMANTDTGTPYVAPHRSDKSVQVTGTFGVGGAVTMEGSNRADGGAAVFGKLNQAGAGGADAIATTAEPMQIMENTWSIRPNVTAGDGTTSLTVRMLVTTTARR